MTNKGLARFAIVSFLLLVIIMWYFVLQFGRNYKTIYHAVPESAAIILEIGNVGLSWEKISAEPGIWTSLGKHDYFRRVAQQISLLDSLFMSRPQLAEKLSASKAALVLNETEYGNGFLFIAEVGRSLHPLDLIEISEQRFGKSVTLVKRSFRDFDTYLAVDANTGLQYDFCIADGLFIGSFNKKLLEKSLDQLKSGKTLLDNQSFARLRATCNFSVGNNMLINLSELGKIFGGLIKAGSDSLITRHLSSMSGWMALDFNLNEQSVVLNGYTMAAKSDSSFLSQLTGQKGNVPEVFTVLPAGLTGLLHTSLDEPANLFRSVSNLPSSDSLAWLRDPFLDLIEIEVSLLRLRLDNGATPVIVFRQNDAQEFGNWLLQNNFINETDQQIKDGVVHALRHTGFFKSFFNSNTTLSDAGWGLQTGSYYMICDRKELLEHIVKLQAQGRTLNASNNFKNFANHLADASSVMLFLNVTESASLLDAFMNPSVLASLNASGGLLADFGGLSVQFSAYNDLLYVSIHLEHNPDYKEESMLEWKVLLESAVSGKPSIVALPQSDDYVAVAQDVNNRIYFLSSSGKILRKFQAGGPLLGDIVVVQVGQDATYAILFNTTNQLFLVDREGKSLPGFPVQLNPQATAGATPLNDVNGLVFRIVVPCTDQSLHSFSVRGRESSDWQFPRTGDIMVAPADHLVAGGRHYLLMTDINAELRIADEYGNTRMNVKGDVQRSANNNFYLNKTNAKGLLMSTDNSGKLFYINSNGLVSRTDFGDFSPDHYFLYDDFDLNNAADFIFVDQNRMVVFDRFKSKLFEQQFDYPVLTEPFFLNADAKRYIVIYPDKSESIYLISGSNKLMLDATLAGGNPFSLGSIGKNGRIIMLTYTGGTVSCYRMD